MVRLFSPSQRCSFRNGDLNATTDIHVTPATQDICALDGVHSKADGREYILGAQRLCHWTQCTLRRRGPGPHPRCRVVPHDAGTSPLSRSFFVLFVGERSSFFLRSLCRLNDQAHSDWQAFPLPHESESDEKSDGRVEGIDELKEKIARLQVQLDQVRLSFILAPEFCTLISPPLGDEREACAAREGEEEGQREGQEWRRVRVRTQERQTLTKPQCPPARRSLIGLRMGILQQLIRPTCRGQQRVAGENRLVAAAPTAG